ncbi:hypothetical protein JKP88DRAFT_272366 [Tribonema minus]|uniref:Uncharacterized protein n=1 Tax=Tribonema minus TaxID=303371 RepID=A0A836CNL0_9STRA|nr:hypothetical protein JKP88DRAFT_272366 [Tribonema minus]
MKGVLPQEFDGGIYGLGQSIIDQFIEPTFGTALRDYDTVVANAGNAPDILLSTFADEVGPLVTQGAIKALWCEAVTEAPTAAPTSAPSVAPSAMPTAAAAQ